MVRAVLKQGNIAPPAAGPRLASLNRNGVGFDRSAYQGPDCCGHRPWRL